MPNTKNEMSELGSEIWDYQEVDSYLYELATIHESASAALESDGFGSVKEDWTAHFNADYGQLADVPLRLLVIYHALTNLFEVIAEDRAKRAIIEELTGRFNRSLLSAAKEKLLDELSNEENAARRNALLKLFLHLADKDELKPLLAITELDLSGDRHVNLICNKLSRLTKLQILNLRRCAIVDDDLSFLEKLAELKHLDLSENPVSSYGIERVKDPAAMETLKADGSNLNRTAVPFLRKMGKLKSLSLPAQFFDDENTESLQQSLPNCKISRI